MESAVRAAVMGAVVGATLGAPRRGAAAFRKMSFFEPIPARMAPSEALDAWIVWAKHVRAGRAPESIGDTRHAHWTYVTHEAAFGRANLDRGLRPPLAGAFQNPLASGADAMGRAAVWGVIFHGDPERAMRFAAFDAAADHTGEAVLGACAIAVMAAAADRGTTPHGLLRLVRPLFPAASLSSTVLATVVRAVGEGRDAPSIFGMLPAIIPTQDPHHAALNLGHLFVGLLLGEGRFDDTVRIVAGCGGAADQTTLAAGVIVALIQGEVPDEWCAPLGELYLAGSGLRDIEPPDTLPQLATQILAACQSGGASFGPPPAQAQPALDFAASAEAPAIPEPEAQATPDAAGPTEEMPQPIGPLEPPHSAFAEDSMVLAATGVLLRVQFLDPPVLSEGKAVRLVLTFESGDDREAILEPQISHPEAWAVAHKVTSFRLRPGEETQFPIVVQPTNPAQGGALEIKVGRERLRVPLLGPVVWYCAGPFVNHDGSGFDRTFRPEDVQNTGEVFNGRSDLPVRWEAAAWPGVSFDVEPKFRTGAGVLYLWAKVRFAKDGRYRVVCAAPVGAILWADRKELVRYHDTHRPVPRAIQPYVAGFDAAGEVEFLVKVLRNREPLTPVILYFLDEEGKVVTPVEFGSMPA